MIRIHISEEPVLKTATQVRLKSKANKTSITTASSKASDEANVSEDSDSDSDDDSKKSTSRTTRKKMDTSGSE